MQSEARLSSIAGGVRALAARVQRDTGVPGIAIGLSLDGVRLHAHAGVRRAGQDDPITRHTRWQLGCIVKLLLCIAALELAREGRLDLDAPLRRYLPELPAGPGDAIRLAHLLSHTSGYRGTNLVEPACRTLTWSRFVAYLGRAPRLFEPGSVFSYEHTEAVLLGEIVRRATGASSVAAIGDRVYGPLGLEGPGADGDSAGHHEYDPDAARFRTVSPAPLSAFWRCAFSADSLPLADYLRLTEALMPPAPRSCGETPPSEAQRPHEAPRLHEATRARLSERVVELPPTAGGPLRELLPIGFGLGLASLRGGLLGNTGAALGQCIGLRIDPAARLGIVVGLTARLPQLRDLILASVHYTVTGRTIAPEAPPPFGFDLAELPGVYRGAGTGRVTVALERRRLICDIGLEGSAHSLRAELTLDDRGRAVLAAAPPQLSLGFFREPARGELALMLGLSAYKRAAPPGPESP